VPRDHGPARDKLPLHHNTNRLPPRKKEVLAIGFSLRRTDIRSNPELIRMPFTFFASTSSATTFYVMGHYHSSDGPQLQSLVEASTVGNGPCLCTSRSFSLPSTAAPEARSPPERRFQMQTQAFPIPHTSSLPPSSKPVTIACHLSTCLLGDSERTEPNCFPALVQRPYAKKLRAWPWSTPCSMRGRHPPPTTP
jgi:hypothetical protein